MTTESAPLPIPASVLFLRMRGWGDELPSAQSRRRTQLAATLRAALAAWAEDRRVVLEAPDGLAVVGEGDPALALRAARLAAQHTKDPGLGIGLHHGPVLATGESLGEARVQGDGVETAAALAGFAGEHPVLASQSFREALAQRWPQEAEMLRAAGDFVDERLRSHALFVFDPLPARRRAVRRTIVGSLGVALLLTAGLAGRQAREYYEEQHRPALLVLDIKPAGEVFVDGEARGNAPPLVRISLPPGPHVIEVRNGKLPPMKTEVQLKPGELMELKHVFPPPAPPARKARPVAPRQNTPGEKLDKWIDKYKWW
ncbi:hypothetical protein H8N03_25125 [Ramlibacter sp. USB13]|uniref:PEGA domain-containing protein n=1 Tax=Ramlibacter cellulosilyticus TaxID=2764187 RepID=A0A923MY29_9BURK|nr:hypothetical protein [Ramlibacter cellulosilyticus]MBC5786244.1 hypothetical protein [Ramlibacter cellulosilyticus]